MRFDNRGAASGAFLCLACAIITTLVLFSCKTERKPFQPQWQVGDVSVYQVDIQLKVEATPSSGSDTTDIGSQNPNAEKTWAEQSMLMAMTVESFDTASAVIRLTIDSLRFRSVERDSLEIAFLTSHLQGFSARLRLGKSGEIDSLGEEASLPLASLGPAFVSPMQLWVWIWPSWPMDPPLPLQGWPQSACRWKRGQNQLSLREDTTAWVMEWPLSPAFLAASHSEASDAVGCADLPWQGLAHMKGEPRGFGLKEFKWHASALSPEGDLMLKRVVHVKKR